MKERDVIVALNRLEDVLGRARLRRDLKLSGSHEGEDEVALVFTPNCSFGLISCSFPDLDRWLLSSFAFLAEARAHD